MPYAYIALRPIIYRHVIIFWSLILSFSWQKYAKLHFHNFVSSNITTYCVYTGQVKWIVWNPRIHSRLRLYVPNLVEIYEQLSAVE